MAALRLVLVAAVTLYLLLLYSYTHVSEPGVFLEPAPDSLPDWMKTYIQWHREQVTQHPNEARYLIYTCTSSTGMCGGIGHRFGLVIHPGLLLAIATQRVFIIHCSRQRDLREVLVPRLLDWTAEPEEETQVYNFKSGIGDAEDWYADPELIAGDRGPRVVRYFSVTAPPNTYTRYFRDLTRESPAQQVNNLAWNVLFRPSVPVLERMDQLRLHAGIWESYVAVQMRMGHVEGETAWTDPVRHGLEEVDRFYNCTKSLQRPGEMALVFSDSITAKNSLADRDSSFKVLDTTLFHIDRGGAPGTGYQGHLDAYAELLLLSGSRCFVKSISGFSNMAADIGHACSVTLEQC